MIFILLLSCREKANDKEFSRENSKPRRESRITTHDITNQTLILRF